MPDIFGRETLLGGVMSAEATNLRFTTPSKDAPDMAGLIVQQVNITYSQNITRLYALEDSSVYFVAGRTDGQLTIQHVLGPQGLMTNFIKAYGDVCSIQGKVFEFTMNAGCGTFGADGKSTGSTPAATVRLKHPIITSINMQAQSQNMILGSGLQAMFVSLEMEDGKVTLPGSYNSAAG
jgi:hypothetical protein